MAKNDKLGFRIFSGERLLAEDVGDGFRLYAEEEEWERFRRRNAERMGRALNNYYSQHPEEYAKI